MRRIAFTALALAWTGSSLEAADLPAQPVYTRVAPAPVSTWTGFYIGANAGYGWAQGSADLTLSNPFFVFDGTSTGRIGAGGIVGGQIGVNYQKGIGVIGFEIDGQWSGQQNTSTTSCGFLCTVDETTSIISFATARARFGVAFDNVLIFASAGGAWISAKDTATANVFGLSPITVTLTGSKIGWAVGSGAEIGFANNWSAKLEYLFLSADKVTGTTAAPLILGGGTITETASIRDSIVRLGLNYRF
jgi:outer membrane immunogenic protein